MFKSDKYDSILQFFLLLLISLPKNVLQVLHGLTCLGGTAYVKFEPRNHTDSKRKHDTLYNV